MRAPRGTGRGTLLPRTQTGSCFPSGEAGGGGAGRGRTWGERCVARCGAQTELGDRVDPVRRRVPAAGKGGGVVSFSSENRERGQSWLSCEVVCTLKGWARRGEEGAGTRFRWEGLGIKVLRYSYRCVWARRGNAEEKPELFYSLPGSVEMGRVNGTLRLLGFPRLGLRLLPLGRICL